MLYLLRIIILMAPFWSVAHAGKCDNMSEGDDKSLCAALTQKAPRFCDLIANSDSRHSCVARVQVNSYACDNIKSMRLRADCLYQVRKDQATSIYTYQSGKKILGLISHARIIASPNFGLVAVSIGRICGVAHNRRVALQSKIL